MAKLLRRERITGWRRHQPMLGKPDFVFRRPRLAVFVDGCFWHACPVPAVDHGVPSQPLPRGFLRRREHWRAGGGYGFSFVFFVISCG